MALPTIAPPKQPKHDPAQGIQHYHHPIYRCLMVPQWLRLYAYLDDSVQLVGGSEPSLQLQVKSDNEDYENIITVCLLGQNLLNNDADITVKVNIALDHSQPIPPASPPPRPIDPLCVTLADGWFNRRGNLPHAVGFQIQDPINYRTLGPYQGIEGACGRKLGGDGLPDIKTAGREPLSNQEFVRWPQFFQLTFLPQWKWGSCYSAIAGGHTISTNFNKELQLANGLYLTLFRTQATETYTINFIEVEIYLNPDYN